MCNDESDLRNIDPPSGSMDEARYYNMTLEAYSLESNSFIKRIIKKMIGLFILNDWQHHIHP